MKLDFGKNLMNRTLSNLIVVLIGISFCALLINFKNIQLGFSMLAKILAPFFGGFVIAFLLNRPVHFFEEKLFHKMKSPKIRRSVSVLLGLVLSAMIIAVLLAFLLPQLFESAMMLVDNIQFYLSNVEKWSQTLIRHYNLDTDIYDTLMGAWDILMATASSLIISFVQKMLGLTGQVTSLLINVFVAIIISVYFLMSKERFFAQLRKVLHALLSAPTVQSVLYVGDLTNRTFNGFIYGKLIDSLIIGIIAFICMTLMNMPYVLLLSVIIGVTNIIPFFGPFIGAIPSAFIIFIVDPIKCLWFILFILVLQQIDGNIIGPKILGDSTGLPAVWVMFAILVGGGLAGFAGMLLGVPTFAVIYALMQAALEKRLEKKGMPTATEDYASKEHPIQF